MLLRDIALSSGSACTSSSLEPSYVLRAIGVGEEAAHTSLRFGFGRFTTVEEVQLCCVLLFMLSCVFVESSLTLSKMNLLRSTVVLMLQFGMFQNFVASLHYGILKETISGIPYGRSRNLGTLKKCCNIRCSQYTLLFYYKYVCVTIVFPFHSQSTISKESGQQNLGSILLSYIIMLPNVKVSNAF